MKIIFEQDNGIVGVIATKTNVTDLQAIALKNVPKGKRFKIVNDDDLPEDIFYDAWRVDFDNNDSVGE